MSWEQALYLIGPTGPTGSTDGGQGGGTGDTGPTGPTGPGVIWTGPWDQNATYLGGIDIVYYGGSSYIKIGDGNSENPPPLDTVQWTLFASIGDTGMPGPVGGTNNQPSPL
jgi:hypothetical protein